MAASGLPIAESAGRLLEMLIDISKVTRDWNIVWLVRKGGGILLWVLVAL